MPSPRILAPLFVTLLALTAGLPAQAQDLDLFDRPQTDTMAALVDVPVPTGPRLPSAPAAAEVIAGRWLAAVSDEQRRDILLDVLSAIGMGVYTMDGQPILYGAEQDVTDPWLYDFEVALASVDPALATAVTVADIAASVDGVIADAAGKPIDPETLADLARASIAEALADPSDPVGFPLRLAREVELLASGRDLAIEVPVEEPLTSLAALLLELDLVMPFATLPDPAVAVISPVYAPVLARLDRPARALGDHIDAQLPRTAQICDRIGSWAGKRSWDIGKLGARVLRGWAIIAGATGPGQLVHRVYLRRAIEVTGGYSRDDIHYRHPGEEYSTPDAIFWVHVGVRFELPPEVRGCGALAGLKMPKTGEGLPDITVEWMTGSLGDHGVIYCSPQSCLKTQENGRANLWFDAKSEPKMKVLGPEEYDRTLVIARVNYLLDLGNAWGRVPLAGSWRHTDVRISWHEEPPSYAISGTIPGDPKGTRLSGHACSLDEPFEVKTKGDFIGTVSFRPSSEAGGKWSYKGKVFNAPFKTVGSGSYRVDLADDRSAGTIDMDGKWTIKIPVVGDQTRSPRVSLTLTAAPPCAG